MKLGILADIHEQVDSLRRSLQVLEQQGVDQVVVLGDVYELGLRLEETVRLLEGAGAVGVWGNHDFGLCSDPTEEMRLRYGEHVVGAMGRLRPRLEIEDCLFTHIEPWLDPEKIEDLWWFEGPPDTPERAAQSFAAMPHRVMFVGHFHRWFLASTGEAAPWDGRTAITLNVAARYLVGVHAVVNGHCAVYDTVNTLLVPFDLTQGH
jgi:hypothetical protein